MQLVLQLLFVHQLGPVLALGSTRPMNLNVQYLFQEHFLVLVLNLFVDQLVQIGKLLNLVFDLQYLLVCLT